MKKRYILIICFLLLICTTLAEEAFAMQRARPTIDMRNAQGYGVVQYGQRDDNEFGTDVYEYASTPRGVSRYFVRKAPLLSRPYMEMWPDGKVYEEPGRRYIEDGTYFGDIIAWSSESFGTITEFDVRFWCPMIKLAVYAKDKNGNTAKYKFVSNKQPNALQQFLHGDEISLVQESYFVQTSVGEKPKYGGFVYDKNGRMISTGAKQTKFSEIVEYDMSGNVKTIYRKDCWDFINEYTPDGKLKTRHKTRRLPYLEWTETTVNPVIFHTIEQYKDEHILEIYCCD